MIGKPLRRKIMKLTPKDFTLEQKFKLLTGKDYWQLDTSSGKIPRFFMADGPNGLRKVQEVNGEAPNTGGKNATVSATAMPSLSTIANSWNKELCNLDAQVIADECIENDVDVLLAPGINIKRTPLCGRNFEYFSEDPYLSGTLACAYVDGAQGKGVGACIKHYCANNRESFRFHQSSEVDERTLREIYLTAFEMAVKSKPWMVMCSYNPVNGVFLSENKYLLTDVLKGEFGFDGVVVSDWGANTSRYKTLLAGLDLEMPFNKNAFDNLKQAYEQGLISEKDVDRAVQNILNMVEKAQTARKTRKVEWNKQERHQKAVEIASEGIVLLKNENALPLKSGKVLVGTPNGFAPISSGTGSAKVQTDYVTTPLWKLLKGINGDKVEYDWDGYQKSIYERGIDYDTILLCVHGAAEGEAYDRDTLELNYRSIDTIRKVKKLREYGKKIVVLVYAGSAIDMSEWIDDVDAVVYCGFGGEAMDEALAKVLTGKVVPSGKIAETFPLNLESTYCGSDRSDGFVEEYNDRVFVGYRYYEKYNVPVLFPFGHGLSYAQFEYSNLKVEKISETEYNVSYDITNKSNVDAKEISQIYVSDLNAMVARPVKELKGFSKDLIKAGETKTVSVKLDKKAFSYYSTVYKKWHIENGTFEIMVGASSQDIKLSSIIKIELPDHTQNTKEIVYC